MTKKKTYSEKLLDPRWQQLRLKVFERDLFSCTKCGDKTTTLHVHHEKYRGEPWEADIKDLKTVCAHCHEIIEEFGNNAEELGRVRKYRLPSGEITAIMITTKYGAFAIATIKDGVMGHFTAFRLKDFITVFNDLIDGQKIY